MGTIFGTKAKITVNPADIVLLHVESSSKCNAWCPACPRNKNGFGLVDTLQEQDLDTARFVAVLDQLPSLKTVQLCGNYGDPVAGSNINALIDVCIERRLKIQIHTNGSIRNTDWWKTLGRQLTQHPHDIWFGLDGIGDVHEVYRQATSYAKVIENAVAFIDAGGHATWQFIPYQHNQHQIRQALITSQKLGFKKFKMVKLFRNRTKARHWRTGEEFVLEPPSDIIKIVKMPGERLPPTDSECMHRRPEPSVYLNAQGQISWCCYRTDTAVDSVQQIVQMPLDFANKTCIINCGRKAQV